MEIEGLQEGLFYKSLLDETRARLPEGTDEKTIKRGAWLYAQYGCNNYTDTSGYPFRGKDVQDAVSLSKREGMELAQWLLELGLLQKGKVDRYFFPDKWLSSAALPN